MHASRDGQTTAAGIAGGELPASAEPVLDVAVLGQLLELVDGDRDEFDKLVGDFVRNAGSHVAAMARALVENNDEELERSAHSLKANAALFGAVRLSRVCAAIEQAMHDDVEGDAIPPSVAPLLPVASAEFTAAQRALAAY